MASVVPEAADFILVHSPGRTGSIIQILQWLDGTGFSDYEHAALYIGGGVVIEMGGKCIQVDKLAKYDNVPHRWSTGKIPLTNDQRHDIVTAGQRYLAAGIDYSWLDYVALVARHLRIPAPHLRSYIESTKHMICSQLIAACYRDGRAPLFSRWTGYVTPGDLNNRLGPE